MTEIDHIKEAFRASQPDGAEEHLSDIQWESLACGELDGKDHLAALDHILGCHQCTKIHQSLLVLNEKAHTFDPGAPVPTITRKSSNRNWVFSGIFAVAATLLFVIFRPISPSLPNPGTPLTPPETVLRSSSFEQSATLLAPAEMDSVSRVVFRWSPSPVAPVSIVQLIDDHGEILWTSQETTTDSLVLPDDVALPSGHYYWRVLSLGGSAGGKLASDLVAFDLTDAPPSSPP